MTKKILLIIILTIIALVSATIYIYKEVTENKTAPLIKDGDLSQENLVKDTTADTLKVWEQQTKSNTYNSVDFGFKVEEHNNTYFAKKDSLNLNDYIITELNKINELNDNMIYTNSPIVNNLSKELNNKIHCNNDYQCLIKYFYDSDSLLKEEVNITGYFAKETGINYSYFKEAFNFITDDMYPNEALKISYDNYAKIVKNYLGENYNVLKEDLKFENLTYCRYVQEENNFYCYQYPAGIGGLSNEYRFSLLGYKEKDNQLDIYSYHQKCLYPVSGGILCEGVNQYKYNNIEVIDKQKFRNIPSVDLKYLPLYKTTFIKNSDGSYYFKETNKITSLLSDDKYKEIGNSYYQ